MQACHRRALRRPARAHPRPTGDRVAADEILVALDNRDLKPKEAELLATRDHALKKRDRAMSAADGADFAAAQVASFETEGASQELALIQGKLAMLEVRSPLAGVIVVGDLRRPLALQLGHRLAEWLQIALWW